MLCGACLVHARGYVRSISSAARPPVEERVCKYAHRMLLPTGKLALPCSEAGAEKIIIM